MASAELPEGAGALPSARIARFAWLESVRDLTLTGCTGVGCRGLHLISQALASRGMPSELTRFMLSGVIKAADMEHNETAQRVTGKSICEMLVWSPHIQLLDISANALSDAGFEELSRGLGHLSRLRYLSVADNGIGFAGAQAIARGLTLDFSAVFPQRVCCHDADRRRALAVIEELYLGHNPVGSKGAVALVAALHYMTGLRTLDMSHMAIRNEGLCALAQAPPGFGCQLEALDFGGNRVTWLRKWNVSSLVSLRVLVLDDNRLRDEGVVEAARAVAELRHLKLLSLVNNDTTADADARACAVPLFSGAYVAVGQSAADA